MDDRNIEKKRSEGEKEKENRKKKREREGKRIKDETSLFKRTLLS